MSRCLLEVNHLEYTWPLNGHPLFSQLSFSIHTGWRVGLLGHNGCGKSTLLKLLRSELEPGAGYIRRQTQSLWHLAQELACEGDIQSCLMSGNPELLNLYQQLQQMEAHGIPDAICYSACMADFSERGGFNYLAQVAAVAEQFGFLEADMSRPVASLSGGEQRLLKLAAAFVLPVALYLMDEPTNYLDTDAMCYLIRAIQSSPATFLIVSHDRWFLDQVVDHVLLLERGQGRLYQGNYSIFFHTWETEYSQRVRQKEKLEREIQNLKTIERSYKNWGTEREKSKIGSKGDKGFIGARAARLNRRATQARNRMRTRIDTLHKAKPWVERSVDTRFEPIQIPDGVCLAVHNVSYTIADRKLFAGLSFQLLWGEKMVFRGPNGCGKTTLLALLRGKLFPQQGSIQWGQQVRIGYLPQHLPAESRVVSEYFSPDIRQAALNILGCFLIPGACFQQSLASLSEGQKRKVWLTRLIMECPNVLILDEPTTHLDYHTIERLQVMLDDFGGTLILVSHDRYLCQKVADRELAVGMSQMGRTI